MCQWKVLGCVDAEFRTIQMHLRLGLVNFRLMDSLLIICSYRVTLLFRSGSQCDVDCGCNFHSTCTRNVSQCDQCFGNTEGQFCERCVRGTFGNATVDKGTDINFSGSFNCPEQIFLVVS